MRDTIDYYKAIYDPLFKKSYTKTSDRSKPAIRMFEKFCVQNNIQINSVLDVGSAWGKALRHWKRKGIDAVGVDVSQRVVDKCVKNGLKCYVASATDLSIFEDGAFDLYMSTDVYEHLRTEDLEDAINEAKRVTGKYFLIRPQPTIDKRKTLHLTVWSLDEWKNFFESNGFDILYMGKNGKGSKYQNVFLMKIRGE